jgi:cysteine-rich repeat protein
MDETFGEFGQLKLDQLPVGGSFRSQAVFQDDGNLLICTTTPDDSGSDFAVYRLLGEPTSDSCGDGVVDADEECDDGNTSNDDGCNSDCQEEVEDNDDSNGGGCALGGGVQTAGPMALGLATLALLFAWRLTGKRLFR